MKNHPDPTANGSHPYAGMWMTADGRIRHALLPNGRYVEARGTVEAAYTGRYEVTGDHIAYWDDTGFTADGDFRDGVLHHAGMVLVRQPPVPTAHSPSRPHPAPRSA
jgi:hypothetical protein